MIDPDRRRVTAFLAGWLLQTVIGVIPYVSGAAFTLAAIFGLGATAVAVWRARGPRREVRPAGKHRAGAVRRPDGERHTAIAAAPTESVTPGPPEEREAPGL